MCAAWNLSLRRPDRVSARRWVRVAGLIALSTLVLAASASPQPPPEPAAPSAAADHPDDAGSWRVLLLFDETRDLPANVRFEEKVRAELARESDRRLEIFSEYLDASRLREDTYQNLFFDFLREKFRTRPPDVVVAFSISSGERLAERLRAALPGSPVVEAVFDPAGDSSPAAVPWATFVIGRADPGAMLELARALRPGARSFYLLAGAAPIDKAMTAHALADARRHPELPPVELLEGRSYDEIRQAAAHIPAASALLTTTFFRDEAGESFRGGDVVADLATLSRAPLLVLFDTAVGRGALGGYLLNVADLAEHSAEKALLVLRGTAPESIPAEIVIGRKPAFDARALERFAIPDFRLPAGSEIRFRSVPVWREYPVGTSIAVAIFLLEAALIAGLIVERRRAVRAESSLQSQAMQIGHLSRVSMLGTISASLAHELNQPLAAILANTQAGLRFLDRPEPNLDELRAILKDCARDTKRAGGVITSLRNMLRQHEREAERVDLTELARETLALVRSELVERRVEASVRGPSGAVVLADRGQIQQVILNLLLNALEAVGELSAGQRRIAASIVPAPGKRVMTIVSDNGPGVPADKVETIFDRYWTTKEHGMGMGLAICRTIVERHGGTIWAENGTAGGASFCFVLPEQGEISGGFASPLAGGEAR